MIETGRRLKGKVRQIWKCRAEKIDRLKDFSALVVSRGRKAQRKKMHADSR